MPAPAKMTIDEMLELPASFPIETAGKAWGMGRHKAVALANAEQFPCPVIKLGNRYVCTKVDLFRSLKLNLDGTPIASALARPA